MQSQVEKKIEKYDAKLKKATIVTNMILEQNEITTDKQGGAVYMMGLHLCSENAHYEKKCVGFKFLFTGINLTVLLIHELFEVLILSQFTLKIGILSYKWLLGWHGVRVH